MIDHVRNLNFIIKTKKYIFALFLNEIRTENHSTLFFIWNGIDFTHNFTFRVYRYSYPGINNFKPKLYLDMSVRLSGWFVRYVSKKFTDWFRILHRHYIDRLLLISYPIFQNSLNYYNSSKLCIFKDKLV